MDSLRAEVDRIIDQHFEPSTLGRIQAVDEIMAAVDGAIDAAALRAPAKQTRIRLDREARETLLNAMPLFDIHYYLEATIHEPDSANWHEVEAALAEIIVGFDPGGDRCQRCYTNARHMGDFLCSECRTAGDPS